MQLLLDLVRLKIKSTIEWRNRPLSGTMIISEVGTSGPPPPAPGIPGIAAPGPFSDDIIMSNLMEGGALGLNFPIQGNALGVVS